MQITPSHQLIQKQTQVKRTSLPRDIDNKYDKASFAVYFFDSYLLGKAVPPAKRLLCACQTQHCYHAPYSLLRESTIIPSAT